MTRWSNTIQWGARALGHFKLMQKFPFQYYFVVNTLRNNFGPSVKHSDKNFFLKMAHFLKWRHWKSWIAIKNKYIKYFMQYLCNVTFIAILKLVLCVESTGIETLLLRIFWYAKNQRWLPIQFFSHYILITSVLSNLEWWFWCLYLGFDGWVIE